jgi:hypothetical protein
VLATTVPSHVSAAPPASPAASPAGPAWAGWPTLLAEALVSPRSAFRPLAARPAILVPLVCLTTAKFLGLFAHFAPSLVSVKLALSITAQGVLALQAAAAWAAAAWVLLACAGAAPRYRTLVALFLAAALWPEVLWAVGEGAVTAAGAYPDAFDPRVHRATSLVWLVPPGAAPVLRALANAVDAPTLYRDTLLALGLPQVAPAVSPRAAAAAVLALRLAGVALAAATA